ncbi:MAG: hypothetical protein ACJ746_00450 [Bryobacteraceae bacterium]
MAYWGNREAEPLQRLRTDLGKGKTVIILGAGIAGMVAVFRKPHPLHDLLLANLVKGQF